MRRHEAILDLYNSALGAFLFISPWLFKFPLDTMRFDAWLSGSFLMFFSAVTLFVFAEWEELINLFIGLWILISPWALGFQHTTAMHVSLAVGAIVVYLSTIELWYIHFSYDSSQNSSGVLRRH
jgi:SPW repeat